MAEVPDVVSGSPVESNWGNLIRDRAVMRYADAAARDASVILPVAGDLAWLDGAAVVTVYNGVAWETVGPTGPPVTEAWIPAILLNGWTNFGSGFQAARYRKTPAGTVHVQAMVKDGNVTSGTPVFVLPPGYRPTPDTLMIAGISSTLAIARTEIRGETQGADNGSVLTNAGWSATWTVINFSFSTED